MSSLLERVGLDAARRRELSELAPHARLARVTAAHRGQLDVLTETGEIRVLGPRAAGRVPIDGDYPTVGDWVAVETVSGVDRVCVVLPRRTALVRQAATSRSEAQVLAANVDRVWIVTSLNRDFNPGRLARYAAMVHGGGAEPVVVLSKIDLDPVGLYRAILDAEAAVPGARVVPASVVTGEGLDELAALVPSGTTVALLGSSGVGKSSLVNHLLGDDRMEVRAERAHDARGRHTTTVRQLLVLPGDLGVVVDTPGIRELQLWDDSGLTDAFADLDELAASCRFRDCGHGDEPGCAVREAVDEGRIDPKRLRHWRALAREVTTHQERVEQRREWRLRGQEGKARGEWKRRF